MLLKTKKPGPLTGLIIIITNWVMPELWITQIRIKNKGINESY